MEFSTFNVGDIFDDDLVDALNTPKEDTEQHKKLKCLKCVIGKCRTHLLGHKWAHEKVCRTSDETINKTYAE